MTTSNPVADKDESPRLQKIEIEGLFETDNVSLEFTDAATTILYGTNGAGKSTVLRIINHILSEDDHLLSQEPFKSATVTLSKNEQIFVNNKKSEITEAIGGKQGKPIPYKNMADSLNKFSVYMRRHGLTQARDGTYRDPSDKPVEQSKLNELKRKFQFFVYQQNEVSSDLRKITLPTNLIKSDRLSPIEIRSLESRSRPLEMMSPQLRHAIAGESQPIVQNICAKIKNEISEAREISRQKSSELDAAFLTKFLKESEMPDISAEKRAGMKNDLQRLHERLTACSLATASVADVPNELSNKHQKLLDIYLEDLLAKASATKNQLDKLELFLSILNNKLVDKTAKLSAVDGLEITRKENLVPLDKLSSGEQHLIVLFYNLIFKTTSGGVCLIDEPEISLNVSWQTQFITDIIDVARVSPQQYIIATHSPQIVSTHAELLRSIEVINNNAP